MSKAKRKNKILPNDHIKRFHRVFQISLYKKVLKSPLKLLAGERGLRTQYDTLSPTLLMERQIPNEKILSKWFSFELQSCETDNLAVQIAREMYAHSLLYKRIRVNFVNLLNFCDLLNGAPVFRFQSCRILQSLY